MPWSCASLVAMGANLQEWLNLLVRWVHLIAGISWIGSSFYFMWLDSSLTAPEKPKKGVEGELWMVHSGGFYQVEKRLIGPGEMPRILHWFKWEATLTWVSGIFLLGIVYYMTGGAFLVDPAVSRITPGQATLLGIALLVSGWFVYDALFQSSLGKTWVASAIALLLAFGVTYGLCQVLSGRAAYVHVGALLGTLMVLNVWVRILPAQQQMIDATGRGEMPDFELGKKAKRRSVHNSYMTFPVLFIMLSNHYPMTYGHALNWLVLSLLILLGASVRHAMIAKERKGFWALAPAAATLIALILMTGPSRAGGSSPSSQISVRFEAAHAVIQQRCLSCHSSNPTDDIFKVAPNGVLLDSPERIHLLAARIRERVVTSRTMPLANKTGMTDEEREILGRWIEQGARIE